MATTRTSWREAEWPGRRLLLAARLVVATVWLFEGVWLKLVQRSSSELAVVAAVPQVGPLSGPRTLRYTSFGKS